MFSELTNATFFGFYWQPQQGVGPVLQVIEFKRKTERHCILARYSIGWSVTYVPLCGGYACAIGVHRHYYQ
ncbi:hypothetical protein CODIS_12440 [Candidatus Thiodiazotropha endolucinida]|uniref:Uncharacterized protein n=1 Tax=Candidatus Thiodiazotropha endolucinida TaxID=1655433 RepID=A0A7Z1AGL5_9GAMM|nr:hypothetical protein CODIS_12440 [Candidatus Thiodiazotropha endolucinida]